MTGKQKFFDHLQRIFDQLDGRFDNEAQRRNLLITPLLVSPHGLGYAPNEVLSEVPYVLPNTVKQDSLFRKGRVPQRILPDYVLFPMEWQKAVGVVEAKRQGTLAELAEHRFQLAQQQAAFSTNWGILTNGVKWQIYHAYEPIIEIESLDEMKKSILDIQELVGREAILRRLKQFRTASLVHVTSVDPKRWSFLASRTDLKGKSKTLSKKVADQQRVEVIRGPLAGIRGVILRRQGRRAVIAVKLIKQTATVEIDAGDLAP